jgi:hypothetical protein
MKRHVFALLIGIVSLAVGTAVYFLVRPGHGTSSPDQPVPAADLPPKVPVASVVGADDKARLPGDRVLLPAADVAECCGVVVSGESMWGISGLREKSVLWDEEKRHLVVLLPNEKLAELQERLTPT